MVKVTEESVSPQLLLNALRTDSSGSIVMHLGIVRPDSEGREVVLIEYEANINEAEIELSDVANEIRAKWKLQDIVLYRRIGKLNLGDVILIAAVAAPHRKEAFEACDYAVGRMRTMTTIRKREIVE